MMLRNYAMRFLIALFILTIIGCSGGPDAPITPPLPDDTGIQAPDIPRVENIEDSTRTLWGIWSVTYDPEINEVEVVPVRVSEFHVDITDMILPPSCDDCFAIAVNGFDPVTRILDADVTLRNPYPISGKDVRGILFTNDYGHLLTNADDWTGLWDTPGGSSLNPFKAFAKSEANRIFVGDSENTENYLVYIPVPPAYFAITFAVDASWPGNCKEPYTIDNFTQVDDLFDYEGAYATLTVDVLDWQDDVSKVTLVATEITGQSFTPFVYDSGNTWTLELVNNEAAPAGEYELRIIADSTDSPGTPLYDYVSVTITHVLQPSVTGVDPDNGISGYSYDDVHIYGNNFEGPGIQVKLKMDGEADIVATDVQYALTTFTCDIDIPLIAAPGLYDVEVTNGTSVWGVGEGLFEVVQLVPQVSGAMPETGISGYLYEDISITGNNFQGPGVEVVLKKDGEPDIPASVISSVELTQVMCDLDIPPSAALGFYDIQITNGNGQSGIGAGLFEITALVPDVTGIIPGSGLAGSLLTDVIITGSNFQGPGLTVDITLSGEPFVGGVINSVEFTAVSCDIHIPYDIAPGLYDVTVTNGSGLAGTGFDLFEVEHPAPTDPVNITPPDLNFDPAGMCMDGDYMFVAGEQNGLHIWDITSPDNPQWINKVDLHPDFAATYQVSCTRVAASGGYAYVAVDANEGEYVDEYYMVVVDVDPPESAYVEAYYEVYVPIDEVAVNGSMVYYTDYTNGFTILDASTPGTPTFVKSVAVTDQMRMSYDNGYVYLMGYSNGMYIIDVDPPATASIVKTVGSIGSAQGVFVKDGYAYTGCWANMHIIDIDPIGSASVVKSISYSPTNGALYITVSDGYAYLKTKTGIDVIDVDPIAEASIITSVATAADVLRMSVAGDYLYATIEYSGISIMDISDPSITSIHDEIYTPGNSLEITYDDNALFIAASYAGVMGIDVTIPSAAAVVGFADTNGSAAYMAAEGGFAYNVAYFGSPDNALHIMDADPLPALYTYKTTALPAHPDGIQVGNGYAYATGADVHELWIYDVTPPDSTSLVKTVGLNGYTRDVCYNEGYFYVVNSSGTFDIIDVDPVADASIIKTFTPPYSGNRLDVQDGYAYIISGSGYLMIADVDPPGDASVIKTVDLPSSPGNMDVQGGYAYITYNDYLEGSIMVVDIDPIADSYLLTEFDTSPYRPSRIAVNDNIAYVTFDDGLSIYELW